MSYLAGLKAAAALCAERSMESTWQARRREAEEDKASCLGSAMEALECAIAIKRLMEEAESQQRRAQA